MNCVSVRFRGFEGLDSASERVAFVCVRIVSDNVESAPVVVEDSRRRVAFAVRFVKWFCCCSHGWFFLLQVSRVIVVVRSRSEFSFDVEFLRCVLVVFAVGIASVNGEPLIPFRVIDGRPKWIVSAMLVESV